MAFALNRAFLRHLSLTRSLNMKLPPATASLLIDCPKPQSFVPDEYDVTVADIMVDWRDPRQIQFDIFPHWLAL